MVPFSAKDCIFLSTSTIAGTDDKWSAIKLLQIFLDVIINCDWLLGIFQRRMYDNDIAFLVTPSKNINVPHYNRNARHCLSS